MSFRDTALNALTGGDRARQQKQLVQLQETVRANRRAFERLAESYNSWVVERAKEDAEWTKLAADNRENGGLARQSKVEWARRSFRSDPFAKRAVKLKGEFCFASGIDGPRARATKEGEQAAELPELTAFWNDAGNQALMFSQPMQLKRSDQLLTDGDLFLLVTARPGQVPQVRRFGSLNVSHRVNDPEDADRALYYAVPVREFAWNASVGNFQAVPNTTGTRYKFYRDIANSDRASDPLEGTVDAEPDCYMMHVAINSVDDGGFGESDLITSLKWLNAAKVIAEDQITISKATASLMATLEAETTDETALSGLRTSLQSQTDSTSPAPPLAGGMNIMSSGLSLVVSRASSQAADAYQNSRMVRMPAVVGAGFAMHYLGDPENANLATASSMELPQLKMLEAYQSLWLAIYHTLFDFVLGLAGKSAADTPYEIPVPKMLEPTVGETASAILDAEAGGLITEQQAAQRMMDLLGFDDIPERLQEWLDERGQREQKQQEELQARMAALDQQQQAPPQGQDAAPPGRQVPDDNAAA